MYAIGIDLGTTNSAAAVYRRGQKETIKIDGRTSLPSVVSFRFADSTLIGQSAKSRLLVEPGSTVASAKRHMGDRRHTYSIGDSSYSPVDIGALVLKRLVESAAAALKQDIWDAVITVPAYFNEDQKADTRRAGEQAGLNVLRLLPEPTAAAISYGLDRNRDQTLLVYDLGGGTFDVSILRVHANDFRVLGVGGDSKLGGDDFDDLIVNWAAVEFERRHGTNLMTGKGRDHAQARQRLKEAAERAKKELSEADSSEIALPDVLGKPLELELRIGVFEELARPLLGKTIAAARQVLRDAKLSVDDIDRVILIGGSTRMRAVRRMVTAEIKEPYGDESPDEAVAWGAAIVAASLSAPDEDSTPAIIVKDVTAHSLGVVLLDRSGNPVFQPLIPRNTQYPCQGGVLGFTVAPMQAYVVVRAYRGEESNPDRDHFLGELRLTVKSPNANQLPVAAVFGLDDNGLLRFRAVDVPVDSLRRPEVVRFVEYAQHHDGVIDITQLESLLRGGAIPKPEEVTIDPWSGQS